MVERLQEAQTDFTFVDGINASQQFHGDKVTLMHGTSFPYPVFNVISVPSLRWSLSSVSSLPDGYNASMGSYWSPASCHHFERVGAISLQYLPKHLS